MKTIGITGGIGSGKSTFCTFLQERGAVLFNADKVASEIMESDPDVREELESLLGQGAYLEDGKLNRAFISDKAFSDRSVLRQIGKTVHPRVQEAFLVLKKDSLKRSRPALVREAAVPPDSKTRSELDLVVSILAGTEIRVERVMKRSQLTREEVLARIAAQATDKEFEALSDVTILNNEDEEALRLKAESFWSEWVMV